MSRLLTSLEIHDHLRLLNGWKVDERARVLSKCFVFESFNQAFAFMTDIADKAQAMNHHPDWTNIYNRVDVRLSTHDAGGLTHKDFALARAVDMAANDG